MEPSWNLVPGGLNTWFSYSEFLRFWSSMLRFLGMQITGSDRCLLLAFLDANPLRRVGQHLISLLTNSGAWTKRMLVVKDCVKHLKVAKHMMISKHFGYQTVFSDLICSQSANTTWLRLDGLHFSCVISVITPLWPYMILYVWWNIWPEKQQTNSNKHRSLWLRSNQTNLRMTPASSSQGIIPIVIGCYWML